MIQLQVLNKILSVQSMEFIEKHGLDETYFTEYLEQFRFIKNHRERYGNVPDKATFLTQFPDFDLVEVNESDTYLIQELVQDYTYKNTVRLIQSSADMLSQDAGAAVDYLLSEMRYLKPNIGIGGTDIIQQAHVRLQEYKDRQEKKEAWFFETGFKELDDMIHGIQRKEELLVIVARTNQGKSWVLEKMCVSVWQQGYNVGFVSPEMGATSVGYRFDTLTQNFSNRHLTVGSNDAQNGYADYITDLKAHKNKFIVATPKDFNRKITVSKLRTWVIQNNLDIIAIDGITYLNDERAKNSDNKTIKLCNISEDLMEMSVDLGIPIIVVVQANRNGVSSDDNSETPELDSIRDSDGIAFNASKVISIKQIKKSNILVLDVKKHRTGEVGGKVHYKWTIDKGEFVFVPSYDDAETTQTTTDRLRLEKKRMSDLEDVF